MRRTPGSLEVTGWYHDRPRELRTPTPLLEASKYVHQVPHLPAEEYHCRYNTCPDHPLDRSVQQTTHVCPSVGDIDQWLSTRPHHIRKKKNTRQDKCPALQMIISQHRHVHPRHTNDQPSTSKHRRPKRTRYAQDWQKNSCSIELMIGIAEGGARTHDLEVDLFAVNKSHTLYRLSYPGKVLIYESGKVYCVQVRV